MKITLFYNKSVHENAAYYYDLSKETREKIKGLEKAISETENEIKNLKKEEKEVKIKRNREWFEKFHHSLTTDGKLMIGGRNAQQNDFIVSKHMDDNDLFFHADIQGGTVVVLKDGLNASEEVLLEAAQFAACFSNAWKNANAAVDVYCVKKDQLTKNISGGFVPSGAFAILGERKWFRSTRLILRIGFEDKQLRIISDVSKTQLKNQLKVVPSLTAKDKGALAKSLSKRFLVHVDEILELLPNGKSKTVEIS